MGHADGEISHGEVLTGEQLAAYQIRPMLSKQIEKWRTEHGLEPGSMHVLDYGCGRGRTMFRLRELGYDAYGVDIDPVAVENGRSLARARGFDSERVLTALGPDGRTCYEDEFFDLTSSFQVFEHVQDIDRAARELARITRPGGGGFHVFPPRFHPLEGHLAMPFVHWLPKNRLRHALIRTWVALGVEAKLKAYEGLNASARAEQFYRFSCDLTHYWTCGRAKRAFEGAGLLVRFVSIESPNVERRLGGILDVPGVAGGLNWALSRFASIHLLYTKPERRNV